MNKRFDIVMATADKNGTKRYTKVGAAFDNGKGISIVLDAGVSISTPPGTYCNLYEPKAREQGSDAPRQSGGGEPHGPGAGEIDNIPFAPVSHIG